MKAFAVALLAGAAALSAGSARATDLFASNGYTNPDLVQQVRMFCDEDGRCYHTRGHVYSYDYGPRYRYEHRYYRHYYDEPRAGIGIYGPGGVGVGIGVNPY
jgi:hypothetical protein